MSPVYLDKLGWPVERFKGRPIVNFIRLLIHARSIISRSEWNRRESRRRNMGSDNNVTGAAWQGTI